MASSSPESVRILLVDDDEFSREVISALLARSVPHSHVLTAEHGDDGLAKFRQERPDLVITDLRMLGMTGQELIQSIRSEDAATPIIVITGAPETMTVPGANEVVLKTDLRHLIERAKALTSGAGARSA